MLQSIILVDPEATLTARPAANTLVVEVLNDEKIITIDQIRHLIGWVGQHGFERGTKRAIILQAHRWHRNSPEALLKTLEEPATDTIIILTTNHPTSLPETIRSRCAIIWRDAINTDQLADWGLEPGQRNEAQMMMDWSEFNQLSQVDKWLAVERWLKNKQDIAALLQNWEHQISAQLRLHNAQPVGTLIRQLSALNRARLDLNAHILPRLVFDALLLRLEQ